MRDIVALVGDTAAPAPNGAGNGSGAGSPGQSDSGPAGTSVAAA